MEILIIEYFVFYHFRLNTSCLSPLATRLFPSLSGMNAKTIERVERSFGWDAKEQWFFGVRNRTHTFVITIFHHLATSPSSTSPDLAPNSFRRSQMSCGSNSALFSLLPNSCSKPRARSFHIFCAASNLSLTRKKKSSSFHLKPEKKLFISQMLFFAAALLLELCLISKGERITIEIIFSTFYAQSSTYDPIKKSFSGWGEICTRFWTRFFWCSREQLKKKRSEGRAGWMMRCSDGIINASTQLISPLPSNRFNETSVTPIP